MIGKKNIVFGFLVLVFTAALGPVMVMKYQDMGEIQAQKQKDLGRLQELQANGYEENLEPLTADQIAQAGTAGILSLNSLNNAQAEVNAIKGGPHAHGNLEALLNIAVGLVLSFMVVSRWLKQLISWIFIVGTVLHSGMLYLGAIFRQSWAEQVLGTGVGPVMVLVGLFLMGIAALRGFEGRVVRD